MPVVAARDAASCRALMRRAWGAARAGKKSETANLDFSESFVYDMRAHMSKRRRKHSRKGDPLNRTERNRRRREVSRFVNVEIKSVDLGDKRRNARAITSLSNMATQPGASVRQSSRSRADLHGSYDFFANQAVTPGALFAPHRQMIINRASVERDILLINDTTSIVPAARRGMEGLGPTSRETGKGLFVHAMLAVAAKDGVPLGVVDLNTWAREPEGFGDRARRCRVLPAAEKETVKWIRAIHCGTQFKRELTDQSTVVTLVQDREGEPYSVLLEADEVRSEVKLLVRAQHNRVLNGDGTRLWDFVASQPVAGKMTVETSAQEDRPARRATLRLRWAPVTINPPPKRPKGEKKGRAIRVNAILAEETPRKGVANPISWQLLTTRDVRTSEDAAKCVRDYARRWTIETYFKVLKSECKTEERAFRTLDRVEKLLRVDALIAWMLLFMVTVVRTDPDRPCTDLFTEDEWRVVSTVKGGGRRRTDPPTLGEMVGWVAEIGGHKGRPRDGPPGAKVLRRGLEQLVFGVEVWVCLTEG